MLLQKCRIAFARRASTHAAIDMSPSQSLIVLPDRPAISLEQLFGDDQFLFQHNGESVALYIDGCPGMHLFELTDIHITTRNHEQKGVLCSLWNTLYKTFNGLPDQAEEGVSVFTIACNDSSFTVRKLYHGPDLDSIRLVRHSAQEPPRPERRASHCPRIRSAWTDMIAGCYATSRPCLCI